MNDRKRTSIRKPVRRKGAQRYILLSLLSFAASVSVTRLFLQLTGYPQIGTGELHIAHVLWGGLLLFIATLVPLIYANRWAFTVTAILSGVGVGLFIDEVGKFITQTNNYFFPAAAPIIYAFFLITVLLYTRIRRKHPEDPRTEMYIIIDELEEVLDRDLSADERAEIIDRLHRISQQSSEKNLSRLGKSLEEFIESKKLDIVPHVPGLWERLQAWVNRLAQKTITQGRLRAFLVGGLTILGAWTLIDPVSIIARIHSPFESQAYLAGLFAAQNIRGTFSLGSFEIRLGLEIAIGMILIVSAGLMAMRKDRQAIAFGYLGLLILLTIINLLIFYFDQFSTIINALVQLVFLLALFYYRDHFLHRAT
jgi:HPt (histidine-containing phosphotransfer) domain-containing protein